MGTMKADTGGGEIVQVQGGHIVRATGRKDRHSKVYTSKGPRDRRVRLSAHTAIQFYDVQDRLGFDRPSKAVDWLITKAKNSIDRLAQLPPWHPTEPDTNEEGAEMENTEQTDCGGYEASGGGGGGGGGSSFLPAPELDSDSMRLFFPAEQTQDLGLSLHSNFHGFVSGGGYDRQMEWSGGTGLGLSETPRGSSLPFPFPSPSSSSGFFLMNQNMSPPLMMVPPRVPLQSSNQLSPTPLGAFDEFRRGRFISDGYGFQVREENNNGGPPCSSSPNSGHH